MYIYAMSKLISRRDFLRLAGHSAFYLTLPRALERPNLRISQVPFLGFVKESGQFEPDRQYAILHTLPAIPADYTISCGKISSVSEAELVSQFEDTIMTPTMNLFSSPDESAISPFAVAHQINIDPNLYGPPLHLGTDMVTTDLYK